MATKICIAINIIVFLLINSNKVRIDSLWTSYRSTIMDKQFYRLITSAFTQKEILHLVINCFSLYNLGSLIENIHGPIFFAIVYFIIIFIGGILSLIIHNKKGDRATPSIGASGAICGLFGLYIIISIKFSGFEAILSCIPSLLLLVLMTVDKRIDSISHFTGLLTGIILGLFI